MSCFAREPAGNLLLENHLETTAHWLGIRLSGTVSSADASGARVSLDGEDRPLVLIADGQSPTWGEHRRDVLVPIGDRTSGSITIHWPSGLVQSVPDLPANAYATVTEPRVLTVSTRVAPADGKTLITVDVDPAIVGASTFEIALDGAGSWASPLAQRSDGTWTRALVAPAQPGTARLTLSLDGKALTVRPRLRFTAP